MLCAEWQQDAQLTGKGLVITEPKLYRALSNPDHLAGGIAQLANEGRQETPSHHAATSSSVENSSYRFSQGICEGIGGAGYTF